MLFLVHRLLGNMYSLFCIYVKDKIFKGCCLLYCTHWHFELEQIIPLYLQDFRRDDILLMHVWKIGEILGLCGIYGIQSVCENILTVQCHIAINRYGLLNVCVLCTSYLLSLNYKLHIKCNFIKIIIFFLKSPMAIVIRSK